MGHSQQAEPRAMIRAAELLVFWAVILSTSGAVTRREAESKATGEANLNYNYYDDYPALNDYLSGPSFSALPENQGIGGAPFPLGTDYGYPVNQGSPFTSDFNYPDYNAAVPGTQDSSLNFSDFYPDYNSVPINQGPQFPPNSEYQDFNPAPINQGPQFLNPAPINQGAQFPSDYQDLNPAPINQGPQFPSDYRDLNPAPVNQEPQFPSDYQNLNPAPTNQGPQFPSSSDYPDYNSAAVNQGPQFPSNSEGPQFQTGNDALHNFPVKSFVYFGDQTQNSGKNVKIQNENIQKKTTQNEAKAKSKARPVNNIGTVLKKIGNNIGNTIKNILSPAKNRKGREQDA